MCPPLNILVLDDDTENADALADVFALDDHRVVVAYRGEQAAEAFRLNDFDAGFFDIMMPGKNGADSFIEIKAAHPQAKVYFMTGFSGGELLQKASAWRPPSLQVQAGTPRCGLASPG